MASCGIERFSVPWPRGAHRGFGQPCPRGGEKVRRIRCADNQTNYCAHCQIGGAKIHMQFLIWARLKSCPVTKRMDSISCAASSLS